jgi:hypothetical protein
MLCNKCDTTLEFDTPRFDETIALCYDCAMDKAGY